MREMIKYRDYLIGILADPEEAIAYLQTSQQEYQKDGDAVAFLLVLQSIAEAQGEQKDSTPSESSEGLGRKNVFSHEQLPPHK